MDRVLRGVTDEEKHRRAALLAGLIRLSAKHQNLNGTLLPPRRQASLAKAGHGDDHVSSAPALYAIADTEPSFFAKAKAATLRV